jgi:hypothetical protein
MRKFLVSAAGLLLFYSCGSNSTTSTAEPAVSINKTANPLEYASSITAADLKRDLYIYASDEFEGRNTGSAGQKRAVEFLRDRYIELGIPSPITDKDYFQEVPLSTAKTPDASLDVNGKSFNYFDDFILLSAANSEVLTADKIMYVGYGIDSETYSDYSAMDVVGKIVIAKAGEPKNEEGIYSVTGTSEMSKWSNGRQEMASKRDAAKAKGAKAFILVSPQLFPQYSAYLKRQSDHGGGAISLKGSDNPMHFMMASEALGTALITDLSNTNTPESIAIDFKLDYKNNADDLQSENVLAFIKGSEKPDEVIVISAHLDHEGIKDGEIYNGADDDGSGTVAILEIAEAFQKATKEGHGPKRSILFLHVTGEEKGLLGSRYYADIDPVIPLANTVANLNIDMIGRTDPKRKEGSRNYIYLIGSDKLSTELHTISEEVNKACCNVELDYTFNDENDPNRFYYRSDHYNFAKNNIPVIFYFNGTHDDYHKPTDTPDKIEYDLLENRTRLVFNTAWELANRAKRISVDKVKQ